MQTPITTQDIAPEAYEEEEEQPATEGAASLQTPFGTQDEAEEGWEGFDELDLQAEATEPAESAHEAVRAEVLCCACFALSHVCRLIEGRLTQLYTFKCCNTPDKMFSTVYRYIHVKHIQDKAQRSIARREQRQPCCKVRCVNENKSLTSNVPTEMAVQRPAVEQMA